MIEKRVPRYFTYQQVAEILNVNVCDVRELIAEGHLIETRLLTRWRISNEHLMQFMRAVSHEESCAQK
jgi:excisionase family DNA binding protein